MEIDPLIIYGAFAALFMFGLKEIISLRTKMNRCEVEHERRLSRLEAIINFYFLKMPHGKDKPQNAKEFASYLKDADMEIFGRNLRYKRSKSHTALKKRTTAQEK